MKYFVVSDIHGCFGSLILALSKAGYDQNNPNHTLIVLGDIFDRGREPIQVYLFFKSIPEHRLILVRGNHEDMLIMAVEQGLDDVADVENGVAQTISDITGISINALKRFVGKPVLPMLNHPIYRYIRSSRWFQYIEIGNFIFTHSYIPTKDGQYLPNWRTISKYNPLWEEAHFVDADRELASGSFNPEIENDKILVSGHRPTRYLHEKYSNLKDNDSIFYGKNYVCIDGSVYQSGRLNVFTFESDE